MNVVLWLVECGYKIVESDKKLLKKIKRKKMFIRNVTEFLYLIQLHSYISLVSSYFHK